jgi:hypothetical protein
MSDNQTTRWTGQCGVCLNWFEHPQKADVNPSPNGTFCPVCRDERKMKAPGVVHLTILKFLLLYAVIAAVLV